MSSNRPAEKAILKVFNKTEQTEIADFENDRKTLQAAVGDALKQYQRLLTRIEKVPEEVKTAQQDATTLFIALSDAGDHARNLLIAENFLSQQIEGNKLRTLLGRPPESVITAKNKYLETVNNFASYIENIGVKIIQKNFDEQLNNFKPELKSTEAEIKTQAALDKAEAALSKHLANADIPTKKAANFLDYDFSKSEKISVRPRAGGIKINANTFTAPGAAAAPAPPRMKT